MAKPPQSQWKTLTYMSKSLNRFQAGNMQIKQSLHY
jgi:hypothetical protein